MMFKKITKHGNGRAVTLEKPLLKLLGITDETILEVKTDGVSITFTPVQDKDKYKKKFDVALEETTTRYAEAFAQMPKD